jgi:predicted ATPase
VHEAEISEVARGTRDLEVPLSIREFLEQRFEGLRPELRAVLEAASVAGVEFSSATVGAALLESPEAIEVSCEELVRRRQFLSSAGRRSWPDGTTAASYVFGHSLYQEILYQGLPASRRAAFHRRIGERLEAGYGVRGGEVAAELALHFDRGSELERAIQYLAQAGVNAVSRSAHREAIGHVARAVELIESMPETAETGKRALRLRLVLGAQLSIVKGFGSPEAAAVYRQARTWCDRVGDAPHLFRALGGLFTFHMARAELGAAREIVDRLLDLARSQRVDAYRVWSHLCEGQLLLAGGELKAARESLDKCLALYDPASPRARAVQDPAVLGLASSAEVLWLLGFPEQAAKRSLEAIALAREISHPFSLARALQAAARVCQMRGEPRAARELADELVSLSEEYGFASFAGGGLDLHGWALLMEGDTDEGIAESRRGLALSRETGALLHEPYVLALLAEALRAAGRSDEAHQAVDKALELTNRTGERWYEAELHRLSGELRLDREALSGERGALATRPPKHRSGSTQDRSRLVKHAATEASLQAALDVARRQGARSLELRATIGLWRFWSRQGTPERARSKLAEIRGWFSEGSDTADLRRAVEILSRP